jgi:dihydroorotate dehydrogenase electron transfer subunit
LASISNDRVRPTATSPRGQYLGRVVSNNRICAEHFKLVIAVENFPASTPGQFVQLECRQEEPGVIGAESSTGYVTHEWEPGKASFAVSDPDFCEPLAYLRRPFSIAGRRNRSDGLSEIDVIHRVVGKGTRWLEQLAAGDEVSVLGPLGGRGFQVRDNIRLALLVGGGVGIPPMFYLAELMHTRGVRAIGFVGAQRKELVPLTISPCMPAPSADGDPVLNATEFAEYSYPTVVTTDDGSFGMKGFVTGALRKMLEKEAAKGGVAGVVVYCCGPTPMMKATAKVSEEFGVECQVSLEQPMACGMGTCQSCVVKWAPLQSPPGKEEWVYKLTCTDGPVFDSREVRW